MPKKIDFPRVEPYWEFSRDSLSFPALVDGKPIKCVVSGEALKFEFGSRGRSEQEYIQAFTENRKRIEEIARQKIEAGLYTSRSEVLIPLDSSKRPEPVMRFTFDDAITRRPDLKKLIDVADFNLERVVGKFAKTLTADWELADSDLLQLTLRHLETDATARQWYSPAQLSVDEEKLRWLLARLWDDLLREMSEKQSMKTMAAHQEA